MEQITIPLRATKEQRKTIALLDLDERYDVELNSADRIEAITADGRVALVDIDGDVEYRKAAGWEPA